MVRFKTDKRGVAALEAALLLPVCMVMIFAIVETGWQLVTEMVFQNGVETAARYLETGYTDSGDANSGQNCQPLMSFLQTLVSEQAPGIVQSANVSISTDGTSVNGAIPYTFTYTQPFLTSWAGMVTNRSGWSHTEKVLVHETTAQSCSSS